jgi:hypothetical protein
LHLDLRECIFKPILEGDQLVVDPNYGKNQKDGNDAQNNKGDGG